MKRVLALVAVGCALLVSACGGHHHAAGAISSSTTTSSTTTALPQGPGNRAPGFGRTPSWWPSEPPKAVAPGASIEQLDAVGISVIPAGWPYVAGYTDGSWPTINLLLAAFPHSHILTVTVNTSGHADCLDIEPGDATPDEAASWVRADEQVKTTGGRQAFPRPCIYAPLYLWQDIWANLNANGIPRSSVWEWDAHWDYFAHIDQGFDATQWTDSALGHPHLLDESMVSTAMVDGIFGAPPKPVNPHHYNWLPNTRRTFHVNQSGDPCMADFGTCQTVHARERNAVEQWDKRGCSEPARRPVCREMRLHMTLLDARIQYVAHRTVNLQHRAKHPRWGAVHYHAKNGHKTTLGAANQQLVRRLSNKHHGVVPSWSAAE
jgi:hypothetical protein